MVLVGELLMGCRDVSFNNYFLHHISYIMWENQDSNTTTCLQTVVGGKQGNAPCKILSLPKMPLFMSVEIHRDYKTVTKLKQFQPRSILANIAHFKTVAFVCQYWSNNYYKYVSILTITYQHSSLNTLHTQRL